MGCGGVVRFGRFFAVALSGENGLPRRFAPRSDAGWGSGGEGKFMRWRASTANPNQCLPEFIIGWELLLKRRRRSKEWWVNLGQFLGVEFSGGSPASLRDQEWTAAPGDCLAETKGFALGSAMQFPWYGRSTLVGPFLACWRIEIFRSITPQ
jgi:hypothetical protein